MTDDEEKMLDECLAAEDGLTCWELGFVEDLDRHWRRCELTDKQYDRLQLIADKLA